MNDTGLLEISSPDKLVSPEKDAFRVLRIDYKDPVLKLTPQGRVASLVVRELNTLKKWAYDNASNATFNGDLDPLTIDKIVKEVDLRTKVLDANIELTSYFGREGEQTNLEIPDSVLEDGSSGPTVDIPIEDFTQLQHFVSHCLVRIAHDVKGQPLNHVGSFLQILKKLPHHSEVKEKIRDAFRKINSTVDKMVQEVAEEFKENDIPLTKIRYTFNKDVVPVLEEKGFKASNINFLIDSNIPEDATVRLPFHIICRSLSNIADNSIKAKGKIFSVKVSLSKDGRNVEIVCEDDGSGYPERIIELGFIVAKEKGIHGWEDKDIVSTGVGMAKYTEMIEKSGGKMIPEKGENGIGARTRIILPVSF